MPGFSLTRWTQAFVKLVQDYSLLGSLLIVGCVSLLTAEQVSTGWIALGSRINISRRDFNNFEMAVIILGVIWGVLAFWGAWQAWSNKESLTLDPYLQSTENRMTTGVILAIAMLALVGIVLFIVAEQVATGWLALGDRANISRRDLNPAEWIVMVAAGFWGIINLRTAFGLWMRQGGARIWAEWISLLNIFIAVAFLLNGVIQIDTAIESGTTFWEDFGGVLWELAPLVLLFSFIAVYRVLTAEVDTTADEIVRNSLAKSPAAGAIVGFVTLYIFFWITTPLFLQTRAQAGIFTNNATSGIIAIGITMLMISGEFDLSIGSIYGASSLIFLLMMTEGAFGIDALPVIPALVCGLIFGAALGFINGILLIRTGIPSFIVTLGTMLAYRAIPLTVIDEGRILRYADFRLPPPTIYVNRWIIIVGAIVLSGAVIALMFPTIQSYGRDLLRRLRTYGSDVTELKDFLLVFSLARLVVAAVIVVGVVAFFLWGASNQLDHTGSLLGVNFFSLANGQIREVPIFGTVPIGANLRTGVIWWLLMVIIFQFLLVRTPYGNAVFAVGGNPGAARAQGVNVNGIKLFNFMLAGALAAFAGALNVSYVTSVNANLGDGLELEVIAAAVIGGALLSGGYGSIFGALLGILITGMVQTGLVLLGVDPRVINGVNGVIIILAVIVNTTVRQQKK